MLRTLVGFALAGLGLAGCDSRPGVDAVKAEIAPRHRVAYHEAVQHAQAAAAASGNPCYDAIEKAAGRYVEFAGVNLADPPEPAPAGGGRQTCIVRFGGHVGGLEVRRDPGQPGNVRILRAMIDGAPATPRN